MPVAKRKPAKRRTRKQRPPSRQQLLEHDPWHFRRIEDPTFIAICKVVREHPNLVYYTVDWRGWYFNKPTCPNEARVVSQGRMTPNPDPICGSMFLYYNEQGPRTRKFSSGHGGGYIERFASGVIAWMRGREEGFYGGDLEDGPDVRTASEAIVAYLRSSYDQGVESQRRFLGESVYDDDGRFVRRRRTPKYPKRARSFDRMMRDAGFNQRLLGLFDREVER